MTKVKRQSCKKCGKFLDAVTPINGPALPKPGSLSVCMGCATISQFNIDMDLEPLTAKEMQILQEVAPQVWHELIIGQQVVLEYNKKKKRD